MRILFVLALMAAPYIAHAETCAAAPDITAELDGLIRDAQTATDFRAGQAASNGMWQVWLRAPDAAAQEVLDRGMAARGSFDFKTAAEAFTTLIEYCPDYAEGWNQRAYISFLREDYAAALGDLDRALALHPRHVAAQSGRALTLMNLGRIAQAREQLLAAVENNPWLGEAALLAEGAPLGPTDKDI